jgi:hypothetical protein
MPAIAEADIRALGRGEWIQRQKGDASVAVWRDQRAMWLLYNHCSPTETASLERWNDAGRKVSVGCPRAIRDYFYGARSVDVLSQLHYAYLPGRKSMRSWPRLAWWLLDMCVINAFQLWTKGQQHLGQLRFREELMHELLKQLPSEAVPRKRGAGLHPAHALASEHFSLRVDEEKRKTAQSVVTGRPAACAHTSSAPHAKRTCAKAPAWLNTTSIRIEMLHSNESWDTVAL